MIFNEAREKGASEWTDTHDKELTWQRKKEAERHMDGYRVGELLPDEISAELPEATRAATAKAKLNRKNRERVEARKARLIAGPGREKSFLQGERVFIEESAKLAIGHIKAQAISEKVRQGRGGMVRERRGATLFIASDPSRAHQSTRWTVALSGGRVCSVDYILRGGQGRADTTTTTTTPFLNSYSH